MVNRSTPLEQVETAVQVLRNGGVIGYPTEYCFGIGCDPRSEAAMSRLLAIKRRQTDQGVILIAANTQHVELYAILDGIDSLPQILDSWPGPHTWVLPAQPSVPAWVRGRHQSIAMRIPAHSVSYRLCEAFGHPIVSTSANRHQSPALLNTEAVLRELGDELDFVIDAPVGGASRASAIRDAISGQILR